MESPYNRPVAANLIMKAANKWADSMINEPFLCGWSVEMCIYDALKRAGYLTEEAMLPDEN